MGFKVTLGVLASWRSQPVRAGLPGNGGDISLAMVSAMVMLCYRGLRLSRRGGEALLVSWIKSMAMTGKPIRQGTVGGF